MYLYKSPQSVYYIRICTPKHLKALGYPFDFKISLLTKTKKQAQVDGFKLVSAIKFAMNTAPALSFDDFKSNLTHLLDAHRNQNIDTPQASHCVSAKKTARTSNIKAQNWIHALDAFIVSKQQEAMTPLTCHQLNQRVSAFFDC